jgi:hypothetical protein
MTVMSYTAEDLEATKALAGDAVEFLVPRERKDLGTTLVHEFLATAHALGQRRLTDLLATQASIDRRTRFMGL